MTDQQIAQACCRGGGEMVKAFAWGQTPFQFALVLDTQGGSTSQLYGLFATTCGAGLLTSSWALTFWICAACSLSCWVSCATVACSSSTLRLSIACDWVPIREDTGVLFPLASTAKVPNFPSVSTPTTPTKFAAEI